MKVNKKNLNEVPDDQLCIVIAGSQGQTGSSLVRAVSGEHRMVSLSKGDKVIFASEPIPGSESAVYGTIDSISEQGVEVAYSDVSEGLHVSGHAGEYEQMLLVHLLRAKYFFPIGGEERHRVQFGLKIQDHGYKPQQVVLPHYGKLVEFHNGEMKYGGQVNLRERTITVEGSTVGVIEEDLEDRTKLGTQGMVVAVLNKIGDNYDLNEIFIEERGLGLGSEERQGEFYGQVQFTIQDVVKNFKGDEQALAATLEKAIFGVLRREFNRTPVVMAIINVV
jgi:ribonuclease J